MSQLSSLHGEVSLICAFLRLQMRPLPEIAFSTHFQKEGHASLLHVIVMHQFLYIIFTAMSIETIMLE